MAGAQGRRWSPPPAGVGGAGEAVEAELGADVAGGGERAAVEGDAGRVGDAGEAVERAHREGRLDDPARADGGAQPVAGGGEVGKVVVGGGGEVEQQVPVGHTGAGRQGVADVDRRAEGRAARTEQRHVARRSIEALLPA